MHIKYTRSIHPSSICITANRCFRKRMKDFGESRSLFVVDVFNRRSFLITSWCFFYRLSKTRQGLDMVPVEYGVQMSFPETAADERMRKNKEHTKGASNHPT